MRELPRLTEERLRKAEEAGKAEGWYKLCMKGYRPDEIAGFGFESDRHMVRSRVRDFAASRSLPVPANCAPVRERPRTPWPEDWRAAFKLSVMRTGLMLSLTQSMLEYLCSVSENTLWDRFGHSTNAKPDNSIATAAALAKRGLIRHRTKKAGPLSRDSYDWEAHYELTEAGEILVQLLKVVGVFRESDRAIERRHARKRT